MSDQNMIPAQKTLWGVYFNITRNLNTFPQPRSLASDIVFKPEYFFEGRLRKSNDSVFQYTLEGEGVFEDQKGQHRLPPGYGFLCRISDPETKYYFPKHATNSWKHVFIGFMNANSMVDELVSRFGYVYRVDITSPAISRMLEYERQNGSIIKMSPGQGATLVTNLLSTLADSGAEETHNTASAFLVRQTKEQIDLHLEKNINVTQVAQILGVSHEHLSRVFKSEMGISLHRYLTQKKIRKASELLKDTALSCKQICASLKFDNASHFARSFKRITGVSPMDFRRKSDMLSY